MSSWRKSANTGLPLPTPAVFVGDVPRDHGFGHDTNEEVVGIAERFAKARIPTLALTAEIASEQPTGAIGVERFECGPPADANVVD
jgi:hypothetical protein